MSGIIRERAYGKVNFSLKVTGKDGDLHTIDSVMCNVMLFDGVQVALRDDGQFKLSIVSESLDDGFDETVYACDLERSVKKLFSFCGAVGMDVTVTKNIPFSSGLGGSSAVIAALARIIHREKGFEFTPQMLLSLGSDVPYMYVGGYARVGSKGETVSKIDSKKEFWLVLCKSEIATTANAAYRIFDLLDKHVETDNDLLCKLLGGETASTPTPAQLRPLLANDLEHAVRCGEPPVKKAADALINAGAEYAVMSGSGSTFFAVCKNAAEALQICAKIDGFWKKAVKTVPNPYEF